MPPMPGSIFEWDEAKNRANQAKHGVSFERARLAFADPRRVIRPDLSHSALEQRFFRLGLVDGRSRSANWHADYQSHDNPHWSELSVLQAAHAGEILVESKIAEEHPLLIFEQIPKCKASGMDALSLGHFVEHGRTVQFNDLPGRLWATTGIRLQNFERYRAFGRLRNDTQHFTIHEQTNSSKEAINFIYCVINPFINLCWYFYTIDYTENHELFVYLMGNLIRHGVRFLVSPEAASHLEYTELDWTVSDRAYRKAWRPASLQCRNSLAPLVPS